jgi:rhodanese-related sulfurtransferase
MNIQQKMNSYNEALISTLWDHKIKFAFFSIATLYAYSKVPEINEFRSKLEQKKNHEDKLLNKSDLREISDIFDKILDVRTAEEYERGHVKGSIHMEYKDIVNDENVTIRLKKSGIRKLDTVLIYCKSGNRASIAREHLIKKHNFKPDNIYITNLSHEDLSAILKETQND